MVDVLVVAVIVAFFVALICVAAAARAAVALRATRLGRRQFTPPIQPLEWASAIVLAALHVARKRKPVKLPASPGSLDYAREGWVLGGPRKGMSEEKRNVIYRYRNILALHF